MSYLRPWGKLYSVNPITGRAPLRDLNRLAFVTGAMINFAFYLPAAKRSFHANAWGAHAVILAFSVLIPRVVNVTRFIGGRPSRLDEFFAIILRKGRNTHHVLSAMRVRGTLIIHLTRLRIVASVSDRILAQERPLGHRNAYRSSCRINIASNVYRSKWI